MIRILVLLFVLVGFQAQAALKLPVPDQETLPNGLQLVWFSNEALPVIDMVVLVRSGFRDDAASKSGTAQLVSALLDRGAAGMTAPQIAKAVEKLGASRYVSADEETFSVGMHGLAPDAEPLLDLLSKLVLQPDFPQQEVEREHGRILDRWNHLGDYGESLVSLAYRRVLAAGTSYARGSFLNAQEFKKVGREDVLAFYKKHFTPKNAVLMVVGRVDKPKFREKILSLFGGWSCVLK